jgi:pimeloyl-ACP methyl ester carboxylesterase
VRDHSLTLRGLTHHVVEWEGPDFPTVVMLHGYLDHAHIFDRLAAELDGIRLLALDFRGMGDTGWVGAGGYYHFPDYVADTHAVITQLVKGPVVLLGHSMGGSVAIYLAGAFPELISHLCLIEGIGPPSSRLEEGPLRMRGFIEDLARAGQRTTKRFPSVEAAAARVRERNPRITPDDALAFARHGTRADGDGLVWKFDPLHQTRAPMMFTEEAQLPFLQRVTAPTLIVEGSQGFLLEDETRARRLAAFRRSEVLRIPGAGHHVQLDAPAEIAKALRKLIDS